MCPGPNEPGPAFEDVQFLTGSANRVEVLTALTDGPVDRRDLRDDVGISQPTTSRTLAEFEERGWVTHDGRRFRTTPLGTHVAESVASFVEEMESARRLADVVQWFPEEGFGFDLDRLATADVVSVSEGDVGAPVAHLARQLAGATNVLALSHGITSSLMRAWPAGSPGSDRTVRWVFGPAVLDVLRADPEMATRARRAVESGGVDYFCYDGEVPFNVVVTDDTVNLCLTGGSGAPNAEIQTDDAAVLAWAESTIEAYRRDATPVTPDVLDA
ncbi:helix-turn-helix transcriptional regulator [Haloarchaeobius sp. HRN-SO-5]|uniref:helix-turn-helix transcriptional regulator n=1 Tax=Haloarchaeobius sp. HRN-SO-5 TaxID=3446118 RepID=UPI003EBD0EAA